MVNSKSNEEDEGDLYAAALGVRRLALPTPFAIGDVNAYLIEDEPLTLIDCGPSSLATLAALEAQLAAVGRAIGDIELIIVTHQHVDHVGLAAEIARRSGAEIHCLGRLGPMLRDWEDHTAAEDEYSEELMLRHGISAEVTGVLRTMASLVHGWGASSPVAETFEDGEEIVLRDRRLIVAYRPGHSPTDTVLFDRATGLAFTGDHLLAEISSSPLISRPSVGEDARRPRPLLDFRQSLQETRRLDISVALPGHGRPFTDHRALIDARLQAQARRAERFYDLLAEGPLNAREIATREWPSFAIAQAFLTLSAVLGVLDLLIEEGRVVEDADRTAVRFRQSML